MTSNLPDRTPTRTAIVAAACVTLYYIAIMTLIVVLIVGAVRWAF